MKMMTLEDCEQQFQRHIVKGMPHGIMETQLCATIVVEEGHTRSEHFKQLKPLEVRKCVFFCPLLAIISLGLSKMNYT